MLVIRHRTGPLAGNRQELDGRNDRIVFGRDAEVCNVVFPAEETLVSRRHFALERKLSGAWTVALFGDPFVAINGEPAENGREVHAGDVIELGKRGGPSFEVTGIDDALTSKLAPTQMQEKAADPRTEARRARRWALAGVALAVIAGGGAGLAWLVSSQQSTRLDRAVAELADRQTRAASESISAATRERLLAASYVVLIRYASGHERATGTASPIAPNLLATNAHIVELAEELGKGDKLFVRAPGPGGQSYEVVEAKKHPGYTAFSKFLREDPIFVVSVRDCPTCFPSELSESPSYDVGTLRIGDEFKLSPILEIATPQELADLKPGTALAMAGYPLERIRGSEVQPIGATPTLSLGMVTALTDFFNLPAEPGQRRMVQHNLPGTGGNSGSPMVTPNGKIVALHNAGSYINVPNVGRVPNAAMIRYGQRADMLADLVAGRAEATLAEDRAYWGRQTAAFKRGYEVIVPWILDKRKPQGGGTAVLASESKHSLVKADQFKAPDREGKESSRRQKIHSVSIKGGRTSTFIAYAQESARIQLYLVIDGKIVEQNERNIWFPDLSHRPLGDIKADIYVVGKDADVNYTLLEYVWDAPRS
jgi:hypothetical protein